MISALWFMCLLPSYTGPDYSRASERLSRPLPAHHKTHHLRAFDRARERLEQGVYLSKRPSKSYRPVCEQEYAYYSCSIGYRNRIVEEEQYSYFYCKGCDFCQGSVCGVWPCDSALKGKAHSHEGQGVFFPEQDQCPFLAPRSVPLLVRPQRVEKVAFNTCLPYENSDQYQCVYVHGNDESCRKIYRQTIKDTCTVLEEKGCSCHYAVCAQKYEGAWCKKWNKTFECQGYEESVIPMPHFTVQGKHPPQEPLNNTMGQSLGSLQGMSQGLQQHSMDKGSIRVFQGQPWRCHVDAVQFRNCCGVDDGWGQHLGYGCSQEEHDLMRLRKEKRCVFVGSYVSDHIVGVSLRKRHMFCCFSSPLVRLLQEHARRVLHKNWGTPAYPDCEGLLIQEEMSKVDFSTIDQESMDEILPALNKEINYEDIKRQIKESVKRLEHT